MAIREVHKVMYIGIHESEARAMMAVALAAAGLQDGKCLTLFGGGLIYHRLVVYHLFPIVQKMPLCPMEVVRTVPWTYLISRSSIVLRHSMDITATSHGY